MQKLGIVFLLTGLSVFRGPAAEAAGKTSHTDLCMNGSYARYRTCLNQCASATCTPNTPGTLSRVGDKCMKGCVAEFDTNSLTCCYSVHQNRGAWASDQTCKGIYCDALFYDCIRKGGNRNECASRVANQACVQKSGASPLCDPSHWFMCLAVPKACPANSGNKY